MQTNLPNGNNPLVFVISQAEICASEFYTVFYSLITR